MISQQSVDAIVARVKESALDESVATSLRAEFPDLHFTWCMDDDLGSEEPLLEFPDFNLYLVDGEGHCLKLTTDLARANGVVIAEVIE